MISSETQFNKYGWKLKVIKSKDTTTIMQRSKHGIHKYSKPMTLRLQNEDIKELIEMLKEANNLLNDANSGEGVAMKYECCSKDKIRFELESWYKDLEDNKMIEVKITKCPVMKGTFDLEVSLKETTK